MNKTLSSSLTWDLYRDWIRGPFQVRTDAALTLTQNYSTIEARLARKSGVRALEVTVPFGTRVALRSGPFVRVLWDGTLLQHDAEATQTLRVVLDQPTLWLEVRTASGDADWVTYGGVPLAQSAVRTLAAGGRALLSARWAILAALLIHALMLALTWEGLWQTGDGAITATPIEMAAVAPEPEVAPARDESSAADAFNGSFNRAFSRLGKMAQAGAQPQAQAKVAQGGGSGWRGLFSGFRSAAVGAPQVRAAQQPGAATLTSADSEIFAEIIRRSQERTRACYERALMQDETLAVDLQYEADVVSRGAAAHLAAGRYTAKGDGSAAARQTLTRCLDQVLGSAEIPARFRGVTLRYQFMFKS